MSAGARVRTCPASPQKGKKGAFIDGEYVEDYVYVPDFMSPEELKKEHRRAFATDIVIVDTAAPPVWEEEHIPGAVNFPYSKHITAPVPLPRDKNAGGLLRLQGS